MRRLPPLPAIEAFVAVARLGSVKAAAESLSLSSPALSRRLAALERFVGQPLFERRHQALAITLEGERLLSRIAPVLESLAAALERPTAGGELMRLTLGVQPLFATQRLMPHLAELRARHPELHLDLDTAPHPLSRLNEGLDAWIGLQVEPDPSLYARRLDTNRLVAIASHEKAKNLSAPEALSGDTLLVHRDMAGTFELWREAIGHPELEPGAVDHFDSGQLMLDAAAGGLGVAVMLDSHIAAANDDRLVPLWGLSTPSPYNYWFVARRSAMARRPVRLFHDWLFATLSEAEERRAA